MGSVLVFAADDGVHGTEVWRTDGTEAGTWLIEDISPRDFYLPLYAVGVGGKVYFWHYDEFHGHELWRTDGTAAGTDIVIEFQPGPAGSLPTSVAAAKGLLYFTAPHPDFGLEPFRTDGTASGTEVFDLVPGANSGAAFGLTAAGNRIFFNANDLVHGYELWAIDLERTLLRPSGRRSSGGGGS